MAWTHVIARKFARILRDPAFVVISREEYVNEYGLPGWRISGDLGTRRFYISKAHCFQAPELEEVASVINNGDSIDLTKEPLYQNRQLGDGVRVEAWGFQGDGRHWYQVFTPNTSSHPRDYFSDVVIQTRNNPSPM